MYWIFLIALALPGHMALCLFASNYINATVVHRALKQVLSLPIEGFLTLGPLLLATTFGRELWDIREGQHWGVVQWSGAAYLVVAAGVAVIFVPRWLYEQLTARPPALLLSNHTTTLDLQPRLNGASLGSGLGRIYLALPGNQSLELAVHEKTLEIPRLPPDLDGLSITHLSDLHFTGRLTKGYFEEVVRLANELESDLVAITGDLVDSSRCIEWLPDTLGRLKAPYGVYFVLGNHDLRAGPARVRQTLTSCGLIDLSGHWVRQSVRGHSVILAGNELPWFKPAADLSDCPAADGGQRDFRILLSHSPDQHVWAQQHDIDLMLAGHTHGGQIRFPLIGPILAPSRYGVRYAAGTFHLPPVVMHVSRGISGLQPLRFNCPPELTRLVLRIPAAARSATSA
jgi:predicted MPP superfamily phosphohydrolase